MVPQPGGPAGSAAAVNRFAVFFGQAKGWRRGIGCQGTAQEVEGQFQFLRQCPAAFTRFQMVFNLIRLCLGGVTEQVGSQQFFEFTMFHISHRPPWLRRPA